MIFAQDCKLILSIVELIQRFFVKFLLPIFIVDSFVFTAFKLIVYYTQTIWIIPRRIIRFIFLNLATFGFFAFMNFIFERPILSLEEIVVFPIFSLIILFFLEKDQAYQNIASAKDLISESSKNILRFICIFSSFIIPIYIFSLWISLLIYYFNIS